MPTLANYQLRLPSFEGPLDVLLGLIERERLEISDLSLVTVTDGFLGYIESLDDAPPALLAEFAGVAARLLVLKSRALLPRPETVEVEPDVDDLAQQLREYQRAKQVAESFRALEQAGRRTFVRPPMSDLPAPRIVLVPPPVGHLRRALVRTLARVRAEPEVTALRKVVTIGEMLDRLRHRIARVRGRARFHEMIGSNARDDTVVGFIALLALWRRGEVHVEQDGLFEDIHVMPMSGAPVGGGDQ
ncbi:MAG TPA: segregation/condensation protein A [Thermomicrobiales bacterium]|nr:segregation/condensation protein A [Thermomicrobiales bacterium]